MPAVYQPCAHRFVTSTTWTPFQWAALCSRGDSKLNHIFHFLRSWQPWAFQLKARNWKRNRKVDHLSSRPPPSLWQSSLHLVLEKEDQEGESFPLFSKMYLEHILCFLWPPGENSKSWKILWHYLVLSPCWTQREHQRIWAPTASCLL